MIHDLMRIYSFYCIIKKLTERANKNDFVRKIPHVRNAKKFFHGPRLQCLHCRV